MMENTELAAENKRLKDELEQLKSCGDENLRLKSKVADLQNDVSSLQESRDKLQVESHLQETVGPGAKSKSCNPRTATAKVVRMMEGWVANKDLAQVILSNAALTDMTLTPCTEILNKCPSLHTLDLTNNELTMDCCSDLCQLITQSQQFNYLSLEGNYFPLRSIGYFMTAIMERQNKPAMQPFDMLNLQGNSNIENVIADVPESHVKQALTRAFTMDLWRFLHETSHPQVKGLKTDDPQFHKLDRGTLEKIKVALAKIFVHAQTDPAGNAEAYTADQLLSVSDEKPAAATKSPASKAALPSGAAQSDNAAADNRMENEQQQVVAPPKEVPLTKQAKAVSRPQKWDQDEAKAEAEERSMKEKNYTFNLKQIHTKNGTVLMNVLDRLLESTSINARDVETGQTLLEYACNTGNSSLAKLCYRRGANLSAPCATGQTPFNIATKKKFYSLMEFLHMYGVKINSPNQKGVTALHVATSNNDVDAICRLIEWGADVNIRDDSNKTPLHYAAIGGHMEVAMLLLELGADLNVKDNQEFTPVAHAEINSHFALMDRLTMLGGNRSWIGDLDKGAGGARRASNSQTAAIGQVSNPKCLKRNTSLRRLEAPKFFK